MTLNEAVSVRLKNILQEKNMSQYRLEQKSGICHSTMISIIRHKTKSCTLSILASIVRALDMTLAEFFDDPVIDLDILDC